MRQESDDQELLSSRRLALAIEAGRMAVWEADIATETITGSPALNRLMGFPEDANPTLAEMRAGDFPGERERVRALGAAVVARGERFIEAEYRHRGPDGIARSLLLRCEIMFDAAGAPEKLMGVLPMSRSAAMLKKRSVRVRRDWLLLKKQQARASGTGMCRQVS